MMQIIGHSLGAHAAGYAGSYIKNGRVGRITGRYRMAVIVNNK